MISGNTFVDNGGNVFLWQNSDRFCSAGFDNACTLVDDGNAGPFTMSACKANVKKATVDTITYVSKPTGSPARDWWNGCMWWTANVSGHRQHHLFQPGEYRALQPDRLARLRGRRHFRRVQRRPAL